MDKIFVNGLKVQAIVGILPHEREYVQPLELDIEMAHDLTDCALTGALSKSINYAEVSAHVTNYIIERRAELLETLGLELCREICTKFHAERVKVTIRKPRAVPNADAVGIEIERSASDFVDE